VDPSSRKVSKKGRGLSAQKGGGESLPPGFENLSLEKRNCHQKKPQKSNTFEEGGNPSLTGRVSEKKEYPRRLIKGGPFRGRSVRRGGGEDAGEKKRKNKRPGEKKNVMRRKTA